MLKSNIENCLDQLFFRTAALAALKGVSQFFHLHQDAADADFPEDGLAQLDRLLEGDVTKLDQSRQGQFARHANLLKISVVDHA